MKSPLVAKGSATTCFDAGKLLWQLNHPKTDVHTWFHHRFAGSWAPDGFIGAMTDLVTLDLTLQAIAAAREAQAP